MYAVWKLNTYTISWSGDLTGGKGVYTTHSATDLYFWLYEKHKPNEDKKFTMFSRPVDESVYRYENREKRHDRDYEEYAYWLAIAPDKVYRRLEYQDSTGKWIMIDPTKAGSIKIPVGKSIRILSRGGFSGCNSIVGWHYNNAYSNLTDDSASDQSIDSVAIYSTFTPTSNGKLSFYTNDQNGDDYNIDWIVKFEKS